MFYFYKNCLRKRTNKNYYIQHDDDRDARPTAIPKEDAVEQKTIYNPTPKLVKAEEIYLHNAEIYIRDVAKYIQNILEQEDIGRNIKFLNTNSKFLPSIHSLGADVYHYRKY